MRRQKWALLFVLGFLLFNLPVLVAQVEKTIAPEASQVQTAKHNGGKDDIQAIGNRKIGGRGLGNWYSLESEIGIGREYSQEVESTLKFVEDPVVTEYVNRIAQNLVRNSDAKVPFTIKVIDSEEINAFAFPGGFLFVNYGVILAAQDEAELAGVMAHEIAHVAARHATRQMTRAQMFNLASIPLVFVGGGVGLAVREVVGLAIPLSTTKFARSFEAEADYLGVEYLYKAGYDPQGLISFFERVQAQEKEKPGLVAKAFSTHPQTTDRIRKTQREIDGILPARETYVLSTSEFQDVKAHLAIFQGHHRTNERGSIRPVLQRRTAEEGDTTGHDQRPTLKRRND
jgi:beta-barrel assembly-enhancing protease